MIYLFNRNISILNVAEKPSVAKAIANIMSTYPNKIESKSIFNPIF